MLIRRPDDIPARDITDESVYLGRRDWLASVGMGSLALTMPGLAHASSRQDDDELTPYSAITTYNNYYEFGTGKEEPAERSKGFKTTPWTVKIEGEVNRPGTYALNDLLKGLPVVERTYRHRCVEAWSMVVPWQGVSLGTLLRRLEPTSKAKFVEFTTLQDPVQMPGQRSRVLDWPYIEGLRLDEAMHPLTLLATGIYGKPILPQNGAPLRLVVPWKYGFKGGKSLVRIRLVASPPRTTWNIAIPDEYGFYANVNPAVDHPRWTQSRERRVGEFLRRKTLPFNGYAEQVASMYAGMDLRVNY